MPAKRLIDTCTLSTTPPLKVEKWQTPHRDSGRRMIVKDEAGNTVYDTDDCYDVDNALSKLDLWLAAQIDAGTYSGY